MAVSQPPLELEEIRRLMADSQRVVSDRGRHIIAWGVIVSVALVLSHFSNTGRIGFHAGWIWSAAIGTGWVFSLVVGLRESREAPVQTLATRLLSAIWIGCGITLTVLGVVGEVSGAFGADGFNAIVAGVLGLCFFASGVLYGSPWVTRLAVAWWLGAVALLAIPTVPQDLLMAGMVIALQVVPGAIFYRQARVSATS